MDLKTAFKSGLRDAKPRRRIKTTTYTLPAHWASALINDDATGLSDAEHDALNEWLKDYRPGYCVGCTDEPEFTAHHDARDYELAADCLTFTFEEIQR